MLLECRCQKCEKSFKAKAEHAGRQAKCPICANVLTIPKLTAVHDKVLENILNGDSQAISQASADGWSRLPEVVLAIHDIGEDLCKRAGSLVVGEKMDKILVTGDKHRLAIERMGTSAVPALAKALTHGNPGVRAGACYALQIIGLKNVLPQEVIASIGRIASQGRDSDRGDALCAINAIATKQSVASAVPYIKLLLDDPDATLRKEAQEIVDKAQRVVYSPGAREHSAKIPAKMDEIVRVEEPCPSTFPTRPSVGDRSVRTAFSDPALLAEYADLVCFGSREGASAYFADFVRLATKSPPPRSIEVHLIALRTPFRLGGLEEYNFAFAFVAPHPTGVGPYTDWLIQTYGDANELAQQRRCRGVMTDEQYEWLSKEVIRKVIAWRAFQGQPTPSTAKESSELVQIRLEG